jgi:hypothetical protein
LYCNVNEHAFFKFTFPVTEAIEAATGAK